MPAAAIEAAAVETVTAMEAAAMETVTAMETTAMETTATKATTATETATIIATAMETATAMEASAVKATTAMKAMSAATGDFHELRLGLGPALMQGRGGFQIFGARLRGEDDQCGEAGGGEPGQPSDCRHGVGDCV